MNILINGVGGPTPRSMLRALELSNNAEGYNYYGTDINPHAIGLYQNSLYKKTFLIPGAGSEEYWESIEKIIDENKIDLALVQPEMEVIEWSRRQGQNHLPCKSLIPDYAIAKLLVDKSQVSKILEINRFGPRSIELGNKEDNLDEIEQAIGYPFWIRSALGSSGLGSLLIEDRGMLRHWVGVDTGATKFLASEYLPGRNLACKMLYHEGDLIRAAVGQRVTYIMSKVAPSGITGNTSFGRLLNEPQVFEIAKEAIEQVFDQTKSRRHGFFTVDLKEDADGRPLVTEINVRHVAFTGCFAAGGANFASDMISLLTADSDFDREFNLYRFEEGTIFLRDVDENPIIMNERDLLSR